MGLDHVEGLARGGDRGPVHVRLHLGPIGPGSAMTGVRRAGDRTPRTRASRSPSSPGRGRTSGSSDPPASTTSHRGTGRSSPRGSRSSSATSGPDVACIGYTWLAPSAQRSGINTEAKLLMMTTHSSTGGSGRFASSPMLATSARERRSPGSGAPSTVSSVPTDRPPTARSATPRSSRCWRASGPPIGRGWSPGSPGGPDWGRRLRHQQRATAVLTSLALGVPSLASRQSGRRRLPPEAHPERSR